MTEQSWSYEDIAETAYVSYQKIIGTKVGFFDLSAIERAAWLAAVKKAVIDATIAEHQSQLARLQGSDHD